MFNYCTTRDIAQIQSRSNHLILHVYEHCFVTGHSCLLRFRAFCNARIPHTHHPPYPYIPSVYDTTVHPTNERRICIFSFDFVTNF